MDRRLFLASASLTMVGCATKYDRLKNYDAADRGYLVLSLCLTTDSPYTSCSMRGRLRETQDFVNLPFLPTGAFSSPIDIASASIQGTVVVRALPPGPYEIDSLGAEMYPVRNFWSPEGLRFPFAIEPKTVTYLGRYVAHPTWYAASDGRRHAGPPAFRVSDKHEDDLRTAAARAPIAAMLISKQLPVPAIVREPMLQS